MNHFLRERRRRYYSWTLQREGQSATLAGQRNGTVSRFRFEQGGEDTLSTVKAHRVVYGEVGGGGIEIQVAPAQATDLLSP